MKTFLISLFIGLNFLCLSFGGFGQKQLSHEALLPYTTYFDLDESLSLPEDVSQILEVELKTHRFVGLAELHRSKNLSLFTAAFLKLLHEEDFNYFALEVGPISAQMLQAYSQTPDKIAEKIRQSNRTYGSKTFDIAPFVFADRKEDALFLKEAARRDYELWGLDQEFYDSFELHLDSIYAKDLKKGAEIKGLYEECKSNIRKWRKKEIWKGNFAYTCSLLEDQSLTAFFSYFTGNPEAETHIEAVTTSLKIYCKNEQGKGSNQERAYYMQSNFEQMYKKAQVKDQQPRVFIKMGSVHLSKGTSIFGVDDMGKFLEEKAAMEKTSYLNIRHLRRYRNGKDLIGKKGWTEVGLLMKLGKKDAWTLTDLRPMREALQKGEIQADKHITYELLNFDFLLIPPNDRKSKPNF
ncbi:MAG: hypothetical protein AAGD28_18720 [Bacteroidota bacterium]